MHGYVLPMMALAIGFVANVIMRKSKSKLARVVVGIPAMAAMAMLFLTWMK